MQRYLRVTRAVGQPRVQNYRLRFRGRIRSAPDSRWMPFEAEQQSFADEPTRLFLMRARMFGVPVEAFHRAVGGHATMQVTMAGVIPIEDARGDEMDRAETVTLFNDMCLLAPGTLMDPGIAWEAVDATTARARFTYGGQTIAATLFFDSAGELVNFVSDDRSRVGTRRHVHDPAVLHAGARLSRLRPRPADVVRRSAMAAARRGVHLRRVHTSSRSPTTTAIGK